MKKELLDMKTRSLAILIIIFILFFSIAPFQKVLLNILEENKEVIELYADRFGASSTISQLYDWNIFIFSQWFGKNFGQMIPIFAIILAFPLFSREVENGTMEFLLVRKSRNYVFYSKVFSSLIIGFSIVIIGSILPIIYSLFAGKDFLYEYALKYIIHGIIGVWLWNNITVFFSIIFNDQVKPILSSIGLLAITTALGFLKPLRWLNTYSYVLGGKILSEGKINWIYTESLFVIGGFILLASYYIFKNKEI
ncbi:ABC transporter permease [Marinitoga litoralis]|uniref:ABC transporter permease n=1 Tax=Marinitoga litoralis TaxID=570855 RepID=UPI00195FCD8C|nr:ABC transporter permease subunit [Marinitoga litoralis]MBM7559775.1 ABC-type transport system involved in multi-copper enzyme maturation permease subunit [Marinitoga litoralis]